MTDRENGVKLADADDLAAVCELEKACFKSPLSVLALAELVRTESCAAAYLYGELVGYGAILKGPFSCEVLRLAVREDARRRGIGSALLGELANMAQSSGAEKLCLEVRSRNAAAIALYEGAGFVRVGLRRGYYRLPADDAILMDLELGVKG